MSEGIIYVLTNQAMPDLVKIGYTKNNLEKRIKELDKTSIPLPFQCFYAAKIPNVLKMEKGLHQLFDDKRVSKKREFFRVDPKKVQLAIEFNPEAKDVTPRTDVVEELSDIQALKEYSLREERTSRATFEKLGIPPNSVLTFAKDSKITCLTVKNNIVLFEGKELSVSAAAHKVIARMGYKWSTINGNSFWEYQHETLAARRMRLNEQPT